MAPNVANTCDRYWDWTLDEDLGRAKIWDPVTGFGGNGREDGESSTSDELCVKDGPFATWRPTHLGTATKPHCLSRDFARLELQAVWANHTGVAEIERVLKQPTFASFFHELEEGAHNAIPAFISGDFDYSTAPNGMLGFDIFAVCC